MPEVADDQFRHVFSSRLFELRRVKVTKLNRSAWICADDKWIRLLENNGLRELEQASALLDKYTKERDQILFSSEFSSAQKTWSKKSRAGIRSFVAAESAWQYAGYALSWRFKPARQSIPESRNKSLDAIGAAYPQLTRTGAPVAALNSETQLRSPFS